MAALEINLTEQELDALREMSRTTGQTERDLVQKAVRRMINHEQRDDHLTLMRIGRGLWKNREDLPDWANLRREWNRS